MDRHTHKVFLAVALGIGLGILAGRAIGGPIAWLLGALIGGASAYVLFAPVAALRAIPAAYRAARGKWPSAERWELFRWTLWSGLAPFTTVLPLAFAIGWSRGWSRESVQYGSVGGELIVVGVLAVASAWILGICAVSSAEEDGALHARSFYGYRGRHFYEMAQRRFIATHTLLPVLLFWHLPRFLWWSATVAAPAIACFVGRLAWQWFRLVHSDLRILCLADAFLCAGIGTLVGGPILAWMIGGGAFGVVNYRIVSIRWLNLKPVRSAR